MVPRRREFVCGRKARIPEQIEAIPGGIVQEREQGHRELTDPGKVIGRITEVECDPHASLIIAIERSNL
jgi:hypothetical protein